MKLDINFITKVISQVKYEGASPVFDGTWKIDSRLVGAGDIFVALRGEHCDGHAFIADAFARGARVCMVSSQQWPEISLQVSQYLADRSVIIVNDPYADLLALASAWRSLFTYPVIGITGSVGKTTTKELLGRIFQIAGKRAVISQGNYNTLLGVALTIMQMRPTDDFAVFEMGIARRGEMAELIKLVRPTTAVITALGHSHMEGLGSLNDIAAEKRAIFGLLKEDNIGFLNGDQPLLGNVAYNHPIIRFGLKTINQIQARQIQQDAQGLSFILKLYRERHQVRLATVNHARIYNVLAASAVAHYFDIPSACILQAIQEPLQVPSRFEQHTFGGARQHTLIDDSYNANPESMKAAILAFERLEAPGRKIAVLGDMLELGVNADFWHRQIGRFLRKAPSISHIIFVGKNMHEEARATMPHGCSFEMRDDWQDAIRAVEQQSGVDQVCVLVKGSRAMGLQQLVKHLVQEPQ